MILHRFIGPYNLHDPRVRIEDKALLNQMKKVLRLEAGKEVILSDGRGLEARARINILSAREAELEVLECYPREERQNKVSLYLSILKKENFELAVQKAIECGVFEIIPVLSERTVKTGWNAERLQKIAREASEQSGRGIVPQIKENMNLEEALKDGKRNDAYIFFDGSGEPLEKTTAQTISIFIGPEGGWSENEVELARSFGYSIASLGTYTLRAETAAIVSTFITT